MQDQRSSPMPSDCMRAVEAAVLTLLLAEDWPWLADELAQRLRLPADLITVCEATLGADGLVVTRDGRLRASWAAVRGDELANWHESIKRPTRMQPVRAAIPLHYRAGTTGNNSPEARQTRAAGGRSSARRPCA